MIEDPTDYICRCKEALNLIKFQRRLEVKGLDIDFLVKAFSTLTNLTTLVLRLRRPIRSVNHRSWQLFGGPDRGPVLQSLFKALTKANRKPREIIWQHQEAWKYGESESLPVEIIKDRGPLVFLNFGSMVQLMSNVRILRLDKTWIERQHQDGVESQGYEIRFPDRAVAHCIEMCPQLEDLQVSLAPCYIGLKAKDVVGRLPRPSLRKLTLKKFDIDLVELVRCVKMNKSLEHVSLQFLTLMTGHWMEFLKRIRGCTMDSLRSFELLNVATKSSEAIALLQCDPERCQVWKFAMDKETLAKVVLRETDDMPNYEAENRCFDWLKRTDNDFPVLEDS